METVEAQGPLDEFEGFPKRLPLAFTGMEIFDIFTILTSGETWNPLFFLKRIEYVGTPWIVECCCSFTQTTITVRAICAAQRLAIS